MKTATTSASTPSSLCRGGCRGTSPISGTDDSAARPR
jgi:hypothetical protein